MRRLFVCEEVVWLWEVVCLWGGCLFVGRLFVCEEVVCL